MCFIRRILLRSLDCLPHIMQQCPKDYCLVFSFITPAHSMPPFNSPYTPNPPPSPQPSPRRRGIEGRGNQGLSDQEFSLIIKLLQEQTPASKTRRLKEKIILYSFVPGLLLSSTFLKYFLKHI